MIEHALGAAGVGVVDQLEDILPPLRAAVFELSETEVKGLNSAPVTLKAAQAGIIRVPEYIALFKEAGTAYAAGGDMTIENAGGTAFLTTAVAGFFNQTAAIMKTSKIVAAVLSAEANSALRAAMAVADLTTGTGRLFITVAWREYQVQPVGL